MEAMRGDDLEYAVAAASETAALATLSPPVRSWFRRRHRAPTLAQRFAWPVVASGQNLLLSAPTGTGKTFAAFLPVIDSLIREEVSQGVRCLYVAPLKALTNDVSRNLRVALKGLVGRA